MKNKIFFFFSSIAIRF